MGILDFEQFILEKQNPYVSVLWWLKAAKRYKFICKVRNYSNHKKSLMGTFTKDLFGYDLNFDLKLPANQLINRSLTFSELHFVKAFNHFLCKDASFIANDLVNKLPNIEAEYPKISKKNYDFINNQIRPSIENINTLIDPKEEVLIENYQIYNSQKNISSSDMCELTQDQLKVIAESISNELTLNSLARRKFKKYKDKVKSKIKTLLKRIGSYY